MNSKHLIRSISLSLVLAFGFSVVGCGRDHSGGRFSWIDSNLPENADAAGNARLEDDFAAAANAEWIKSQTYDPTNGNGTYSDAGNLVIKNFREMLDDTSVTSKNLELLRSFDGLYSNWDHRDELASEPLRKYLERIDEISTLEDVQDYMLDNDGNPFAVMLISLDTIKQDSKKDHLCLEVSQPAYSLGSSNAYGSDQESSESKKAIVLDQVSHILCKLGYSDNDVKTMVDSCFDFESKLAAIAPGGESEWHRDVLSKSDFLSKTTSYDLNMILNHYNLGDTVNYTGDMKYLEGLDAVFTSDNIEGMKAYFKVRLVLDSMLLLDTDSFDYCQAAAVKHDSENPYSEVSVAFKDRYLFKTIQRGPLSGALDQAYLDTYFDQRVYDDINDILSKLAEEYKVMINEKDWISDDSKSQIIEKLDNMIFAVMKPSNEADFGDMTFASYEEGGTLLDAYAKLYKFRITHYGDLTRMPYDRGFWDIYDNEMSTTMVGDQYLTSSNRINVMIGILSGDIYSYDMSQEEKLANIGSVLGHEMSHAFDSDGINFDKNGDYICIMGESDMDKFRQKAEKVTDYYVDITPFEGCASYSSDNLLSVETVADMGGMSCVLRIAAKQSGFDYDRFFRSYAAHWKGLTTKGMHYARVLSDNHPLPYLRINVTVQQFDEFYETYNIQPDDKMYLAPDDRIKIW